MTSHNLFPNEKREIQKALVAFSCKGTTDEAMVMACDGEIIEQEIEYLSPHLGDLCISDGDNPDHGIWVWEGTIYGTVSYGCGIEEYETIAQGEWRHPTEEEWASIKNQEDPWWRPGKGNQIELPQ